MNRYSYTSDYIKPPSTYPLAIGDRVRLTKEGIAYIDHNIKGMIHADGLAYLRGVVDAIMIDDNSSVAVLWTRAIGRSQQIIQSKYLERISNEEA